VACCQKQVKLAPVPGLFALSVPVSHWFEDLLQTRHCWIDHLCNLTGVATAAMAQLASDKHFIICHIVGAGHLYKCRPPVRVAPTVGKCNTSERNNQYLSTYTFVETLFPLLVHTGEADKWVVCGQSESRLTSSGQLHESWERDCNDQANICPVYLGTNFCRIKQSRKKCSCLRVQCTVTDSLDKYTSRGNAT